MQTTEKWKTIPGFPNYAISNRGRIARKRDGYLMAMDGTKAKLSHDGKEGRVSQYMLMEELWGVPHPLKGIKQREERKSGK
jgi:hypothetical protein